MHLFAAATTQVQESTEDCAYNIACGTGHDSRIFEQGRKLIGQDEKTSVEHPRGCTQLDHDELVDFIGNLGVLVHEVRYPNSNQSAGNNIAWITTVRLKVE